MSIRENKRAWAEGKREKNKEKRRLKRLHLRCWFTWPFGHKWTKVRTSHYMTVCRRCAGCGWTRYRMVGV